MQCLGVHVWLDRVMNQICIFHRLNILLSNNAHEATQDLFSVIATVRSISAET